MNKFNFILEDAIEQQTSLTERFIITFLDGSQMIKDVDINNEMVVLLSEDEPTDKQPRGESIITKIFNASLISPFLFKPPLYKTSSMTINFNTKTKKIYQSTILDQTNLKQPSISYEGDYGNQLYYTGDFPSSALIRKKHYS
jgi:hypothetical protein